jgi:DNA-directed RNA polymerase subunit RPC12/RpoP
VLGTAYKCSTCKKEFLETELAMVILPEYLKILYNQRYAYKCPKCKGLVWKSQNTQMKQR